MAALFPRLQILTVNRWLICLPLGLSLWLVMSRGPFQTNRSPHRLRPRPPLPFVKELHLRQLLEVFPLEALLLVARALLLDRLPPKEKALRPLVAVHLESVADDFLAEMILLLILTLGLVTKVVIAVMAASMVVDGLEEHAVAELGLVVVVNLLTELLAMAGTTSDQVAVMAPVLECRTLDVALETVAALTLDVNLAMDLIILNTMIPLHRNVLVLLFFSHLAPHCSAKS